MVTHGMKDLLKTRIEQMSEKECYALYGILQEYHHPQHKHTELTDKHQAYGQLLGEVVESWESTKHDNTAITRSQIEACAAIALKFMVELL